MVQEMEALHTKQQDIVKFVDGVPETVTALQEKLNAVTEWCAVNSLDTVPVAVIRLQEKLDALTSQVDLRMTQLNNDTSATCSAVGARTGSHGSPGVEKDRNVFDVRDYKLSDLGVKPTTARWKKWLRDLEGFIDTIGPSWNCTGGLLRELRHCELPFTEGQVKTAVQAARARRDKAPATEGYTYADKKDVLYRILLPRLDEVHCNELAQTGDEDGIELFRQLVRKLDPPKSDVAFDLETEIEGLGQHVCFNFGQTSRFLAMLDTRVRDYSLN